MFEVGSLREHYPKQCEEWENPIFIGVQDEEFRLTIALTCE